MKPIHYILAIIVALLDLLTKWWIVAKFEYQDSVDLVPGFLRLIHVRNSGVAFGIFQDVSSPYKPILLSAVAFTAFVAIGIYAHYLGRGHRWVRIALSIVMGGILGNFVDRSLHGSVIDFLDVYWRQYHWPTFNVADSAITLGIIALLLDSFRPERPPA